MPGIRSFALVALIATCLIAGCDETTPAEQACLDSAQAVAAAWERCGYDPEAKLQDVLFELRSCEDVRRIRDEEALRAECFPALTTLDCTDLEADLFPEPCLEQILF